MPGKPDPTIYIKAAQKINVKSEDCLVIEDSLVGVTSAKRAGVKEIAVVVQENEFNEDVTYRIHDFYELMEQLWKQNV